MGNRLKILRGTDETSFRPTMDIYKDGEKVAWLSLELEQDLKAQGMNPLVIFEDILCNLRTQINDPTVDDELVELLTSMKR